MNLSKYIEHTNLKPNLTREEVDLLINQVKVYNFYGLCISPEWVYYVKDQLRNSSIKLITVPNWRRGGGLKNCLSRLQEICSIVDEVDYIWDLNIVYIKKEWDQTLEELQYIRSLTPGILKVIIECSFIRAYSYLKNLSYEKFIEEACLLINKSQVDIIKTDSGLYPRDIYREEEDQFLSSIEYLYQDIRLVKQWCIKPIKASSGIRKREEVEYLLNLGVSRIGTSVGVDIITQKGEQNGLSY